VFAALAAAAWWLSEYVLPPGYAREPAE
jgi:hypothetical protein